MDIAEQIRAFEAKRAALVAANVAIMEKAAEDGATLDADQQADFDENKADIEAVDKHLGNLRDMQAASKTAVREIDGTTESKGTESRARVSASVKPPKPAPGIQFARYARCKLLGRMTGQDPISIAKSQYGERDPHIVEMVMKANIEAINTGTDTALFGNVGGVADYVEFLRSQTILGKFGQNGIPALRTVPFYYPVVTQDTGGTAYWVGEGKAKPMTRPSWSRSQLTPLTVAGLTAATVQALKFSSPDAELALRDDLTAAIVEAQDLAFIDPTNAGVAGVKPPAITNGIAATIPSSGSSADAIRADAGAAMMAFVTAKNPLSSGVWIMSGSNALGAALMVNPLGQPEFPGLTVNGGTFMGLPVIVSEAAGDTVTLINAADIWLADGGGVDVAVSDSASLEMVDSPTGSSTDAVTPTELVSMFQTNSVAIRVEKFVNWARRRPTGVAAITGAEWGMDVPAS